MRKISAFTIIELMMNLLISSIVVSMCYFGFYIFNKQFHVHEKKSGLISSYRLLKTALTRDVDMAEMILPDENGQIFIYKEQKSVLISKYIFQDRLIIRCAGEIKDSFLLKTKLRSLSYLSDSFRLVNVIDLDVYIDSTDIETVIPKRYTSQQLLAAENYIHE